MKSLLSALVLLVGTTVFADDDFIARMKSDSMSCQYTGEQMVVELLNKEGDKPGQKYCLSDGLCEDSSDNYDTTYLFFCLADKDECPTNPKDCFLDSVKQNNPLSTTAEVTKKDDEKLKDFVKCEYENEPRTGFFQLADKGWINLCFARVTCMAKAGSKEAPPTFVACDALATVGNAESPWLECPKVNQCVNTRLKHEEQHVDCDQPDLRKKK